MKKAKWMVAVLVLVLLAAGTGQAGIWRQNGSPCAGTMGFKGLILLLQLDLTETQWDQIQEILSNRAQQMQEYANDLPAAREALAAAMEAVPLDETLVRQAYGALADLKEEMVVLQARTLGEIRAVLTPEQIERLDALKAEGRQWIQAFIDYLGAATGHLPATELETGTVPSIE